MLKKIIMDNAINKMLFTIILGALFYSSFLIINKIFDINDYVAELVYWIILYTLVIRILIIQYKDWKLRKSKI